MSQYKPLASDQAVHFGPYRIHPQQRLVLESGRPLRNEDCACCAPEICLQRAAQSGCAADLRGIAGRPLAAQGPEN